jgi:hypothetical protein
VRDRKADKPTRCLDSLFFRPPCILCINLFHDFKVGSLFVCESARQELISANELF